MNTETKAKILDGVNTLADTVKITLGTKGQGVIYNKLRDFEDPKGYAVLTKDGVTVAKQIEMRDPVSDMAVQVVRESSLKTAESSGDGTTTTVILAQEIISRGFELLENGMSAWEFKRHADEAAEDIIAIIEQMSTSVEENTQRIAQVATISSNDREIGNLIHDIVQEIGIYGDIEPKQTFSSTTNVELVTGMKVYKGYYAPFMCTDMTSLTFETDTCFIVVFDDVIRDYADISEYIRNAVDSMGNPVPILIFAEDIAATVLTRLEGLMKYNPRPMMVVPHDGFGDRRIDIMNDICLMTGAEIVDAKTKEQSLYGASKMGVCSKVIVNQRYTCLYGGDSDEKLLAKKVQEIQKKLKDPDVDKSDKAFLKRRLANLSGGIAVINVGGNTKVEMQETFYRIEDAVLAVSSAIRDGVVPGGGYTWLSVVNKLSDPGNHPAYEAIIQSLTAIPKQLLVNADLYSPEFFEQFKDKCSEGMAYDLSIDRFESIKDYEVYDAASVLIDSIKNATTVAKSILSIGKVIHNGKVYA